jgi:hypothetical protein
MNIREFTAGDTMNMVETVSGYPSTAGWGMFHNLVPQTGTGTSIILTSTGNAETYTTYYPPTVTKNWAAGEYGWFNWMAIGTSSRVTLGTGHLTIHVDPSTATAPQDNRSHARKVLDAINATIEGRATHDMAQYMIQGRQVTLLGPEQLIRWRGYYQTLVQAEEVAAGQGTKKSTGIRVHFRP